MMKQGNIFGFEEVEDLTGKPTSHPQPQPSSSMTAENGSTLDDGEEPFMLVHRETVLADAKCPICFELLNDVVVVMPCLDRFCSGCIERCLRSEFVKNVCPCCRTKIPSRRALRRDVHLDEIIRHLRLAPEVEADASQQAAFGGSRSSKEVPASGPRIVIDVDSPGELLATSRRLHVERVGLMQQRSVAIKIEQGLGLGLDGVRSRPIKSKPQTAGSDRGVASAALPSPVSQEQQERLRLRFLSTQASWSGTDPSTDSAGDWEDSVDRRTGAVYGSVLSEPVAAVGVNCAVDSGQAGLALPPSNACAVEDGLCSIEMHRWPEVAFQMSALPEASTETSPGSGGLVLLPRLVLPYLRLSAEITVRQLKEYLCSVLFPTAQGLGTEQGQNGGAHSRGFLCQPSIVELVVLTPLLPREEGGACNRNPHFAVPSAAAVSVAGGSDGPPAPPQSMSPPTSSADDCVCTLSDEDESIGTLVYAFTQQRRQQAERVRRLLSGDSIDGSSSSSSTSAEAAALGLQIFYRFRKECCYCNET